MLEFVENVRLTDLYYLSRNNIFKYTTVSEIKRFYNDRTSTNNDIV